MRKGLTAEAQAFAATNRSRRTLSQTIWGPLIEIQDQPTLEVQAYSADDARHPDAAFGRRASVAGRPINSAPAKVHESEEETSVAQEREKPLGHGPVGIWGIRPRQGEPFRVQARESVIRALFPDHQEVQVRNQFAIASPPSVAQLEYHGPVGTELRP